MSGRRVELLRHSYLKLHFIVAALAVVRLLVQFEPLEQLQLHVRTLLTDLLQ